jgi:hypothetical protein
MVKSTALELTARPGMILFFFVTQCCFVHCPVGRALSWTVCTVLYHLVGIIDYVQLNMWLCGRYYRLVI